MHLNFVRTTSLCLLLATLALPASAKQELFVRADDKHVWTKLEESVQLQLDQEWAEALAQLIGLAADSGDELVAAPPRELVRKVSGYLRLFEDLRAAGLDPAKVTYRDQLKFLKWKKIGAEQLKREAARLTREGLKASAADLAAMAEANLFLDLLHSRYGIGPDMGEVARRYREGYQTGKLLGLLRDLHTEPVGYEGKRGVTHYVSLSTYVSRLLADLPPAGRKVYRERYAPEARRLLRTATEQRPAPLKELARRFLALPEAAIALDRLAEWAMARGDLEEAVERWQRLLQLFPRGTPEQPLSGIVARLAAAHALRGELQAVGHLQRVHGASRERVTVAGARPTLGEHLERMLAVARQRDGRARGWLDPLSLRFEAVGELAGLIDYQEQLWGRSHRFQPERNRRPSDYFPTVGPEGWVFLRGLDRVVRFELSTMKLSRRSPTFDNPRMMPRWSRNKGHELARGFYSRLSRGGLLTTFATGSVTQPTATLVCYDATTLRERWRQPRDNGAPDKVLASGLISSVLGVQDGRVFVGVTSTAGDIASYVYCLSLERGAVLWKRFLCSRHRGQQPIFPLASVAVRGPTVYACTNQGVAAALDASSGRVRWLKRYGQLPDRLRLTTADNRWYLQAPLVVGDRVIFAPPDIPRAVILDAATGAESWRYPEGANERLSYLLGVDRQGWVVLGGPGGVDIISEKPVGRSRLVASSQLRYDLKDEKGQLSDWRFDGWAMSDTDRGTLYATLQAHRNMGYTVSLYRSRFKRAADVVAHGLLGQGTEGVVKLRAVGRGTAQRTASVRLSWKGGDRDVLVRVFGAGSGRAVLTRDQVLVPTVDGILRLDRRRGLAVLGLWGPDKLQGYQPGNLMLVGRAGRPTTLLVSGPSRLLAYRAKTK